MSQVEGSSSRGEMFGGLLTGAYLTMFGFLCGVLLMSMMRDLRVDSIVVDVAEGERGWVEVELPDGSVKFVPWSAK